MLAGDGGGGGTVLLQPFDFAYSAALPRPAGCTVAYGASFPRRLYSREADAIMPPPPSPPVGPRQHPMFPVPAPGRHRALQQQQLSPPMTTPVRAGEERRQQQQAIEVRDVWKGNLRQELRNISGLLPEYPGVCVDTEFPGTVHDSGTPRHMRSPRESYAVLKRNVDGLKLLQLGLALFDPAGGAGGRCPVVWQFNFRGFDEARDPHAPSSIAMLKAHGMDFAELQKNGIDARVFAYEFALSGLAVRPGLTPQLTWVAFSGSYDFAYLAKVLGGGRPLPETLEGFLAQVRGMFGPWVLDVKYIAKFCGGGGGGIRGGLEQVAAALGVERSAGRAHNAGSDSLLTADVLRAMVARFLGPGGEYVHAGKIDGLAV